MAERRMFSKTIIDSDAFLDMPLSAQALYFHLSMQADDDGFVNNPKKIQKIVGGRVCDLKLLITMRFIIPFESGIVAIRHWKINNQIRNDRYKETVYLQEKSLLREDETKAYEINTEGHRNGTVRDTVGIPKGNQKATSRIPKQSQLHTDGERRDNQSERDGGQTGNQRETQYSIGKYSIDKCSTDQFSSDESNEDQYSGVSISSSDAYTEIKEETEEAEETKEEAEETQNPKSINKQQETPVAVLSLSDGEGYPLFQKHADAWALVYPDVDVTQEFYKMKSWVDERPHRKIEPNRIQAFIVNWLCHAQADAKRS